MRIPSPSLPAVARLAPRARLPLLASLACLVAATAVSGCLGDDSGHGPDPRVLEALADCRAAAAEAHVLYFGPRHTLLREAPEAGSEPGNAFSSGFLTNDLKEWLGEPVPSGLWLVGEVTVEYWVESTGTPAPLAVDPNQPGDGYHFFAQFGSDRSLQPAYATEFAPIAPVPGTVDHYTETLVLADGGFVLESGDRVRFLLTDLALDGPDGSGHNVLYGGQTPSQVRFRATCFPDLVWTSTTIAEEAIDLPGNQGLFTGGVPPTAGLNLQEVAIQVPSGAQRLTVRLTQEGDLNPAKDDIDLVLYEHAGVHEYGIGSPYSDEAGTLWMDNLAAHFPYGEIDVHVNSYSGLAYTGTLVITAETARLA